MICYIFYCDFLRIVILYIGNCFLYMYTFFRIIRILLNFNPASQHGEKLIQFSLKIVYIFRS